MRKLMTIVLDDRLGKEHYLVIGRTEQRVGIHLAVANDMAHVFLHLFGESSKTSWWNIGVIDQQCPQQICRCARIGVKQATS